MRMTLGATILSLLAFPAAAEPVIPPGRPVAAAMQRIDFDLLKEAEKQSQQDQADDAAKKAQADKAAADKAAADKTAADKAAADKAAVDKAAVDKAALDKAALDKAASDKATADKSPADKAAVNPPPPSAAPVVAAQALHVPVRLASGAMAGSAALTETSGGLHVLLGFANIPAGRYRLLVLPLADCGKPFVAPPSPAQAIPVVTASADGAIAAAFTVRRLTLDAPGGGPRGPVLALYPADARPGAVWAACGTVTR